jgi:hypothetical protein
MYEVEKIMAARFSYTPSSIECKVMEECERRKRSLIDSPDETTFLRVINEKIREVTRIRNKRFNGEQLTQEEIDKEQQYELLDNNILFLETKRDSILAMDNIPEDYFNDTLWSN